MVARLGKRKMVDALECRLGRVCLGWDWVGRDCFGRGAEGRQAGDDETESLLLKWPLRPRQRREEIPLLCHRP